jgi:hypothetical protein
MIEKQEHSYKHSGNFDKKEYSTVLISMRRKYTLPFLFAIITLISSEYFFLQEAFGRSNIVVLVLTGASVALCIAFIVSLIRKYN